MFIRIVPILCHVYKIINIVFMKRNYGNEENTVNTTESLWWECSAVQQL